MRMLATIAICVIALMGNALHGQAQEKIFAGIEFALIPAGSFKMGSPVTEPDRLERLETRHDVTISKPYYMGKYEVSQAEFESVMGFNPSSNKESGDLPVENVNWFDAVMYCNKLSQKDGRSTAYKISKVKLLAGTKSIASADVEWIARTNGYRLPTEAEWEYACRAGTTTAFNTGASITLAQANFDGSVSYAGSAVGVSRNKSVPVKSFKPNAFGLHNMHGNVEELCWDFVSKFSAIAVRDPIVSTSAMDSDYYDGLRVARGGSWAYSPKGCRSASRWIAYPGDSFPDIEGQRGYQGFRLVLSADAK